LDQKRYKLKECWIKSVPIFVIFSNSNKQGNLPVRPIQELKTNWNRYLRKAKFILDTGLRDCVIIVNIYYALRVMSPAGGGRVSLCSVPRWRGQGVEKFLKHTEHWSVEYYLNFIHLRHYVTPPPAEDI
jgi:hypothetical protein